MAIGCVFLAVALLVWLATTDNVHVWPVRNTLEYGVVRWWWRIAGEPQTGRTGSLSGTIWDRRGRPVAGARVLVSRWDGSTYSSLTEPDGRYVIAGIPGGRYAPVAGAPGYRDVVLGRSLTTWPPAARLTRPRVPVYPGKETRVDGVLTPAPAPRGGPAPSALTGLLAGSSEASPVGPFGSRLVHSPPELVACDAPIRARASRRTVTDAGLVARLRGEQPALLYTPEDAQPSARFPLLLTVYPGPADEWECASLPLAAAGYAVVAVGPPYSFDLERHVDGLQRLLLSAREQRIDGADGTRSAVLGGSYSALHVLRLLERRAEERGFRAAVLLGPPADLFDMRRRLEDRTFVPPFGLDQVLVALGLPDRAPLRYWRYSGVYHVRAEYPPVLLVHSRDDPVVPFQQGELLAAALQAAGVPHELHVFEGAGHYLLSPSGEAQAIYDLTVRYLDERLK